MQFSPQHSRILCGFAATLLLTLLQTSAQAAIGDSLELYLPLNESTGYTAEDASGNARDGAVVNRGGAINNLQTGDPLPVDPLNTSEYFWVPGRFDGGFAPAGAPDVDGDPNPPFCNTASTCTDPFDPQHYAGSSFAMVGVNLTNGATTGGIPANITSDAFTYSFHLRMPYNAEYSKDVGNSNQGDDTVRGGHVLLDGLRLRDPGTGLGLASSDTNFWEPYGIPSIDHIQDNRWAWTAVEGLGANEDQLFHHHRAGAVPLFSDAEPPLFDVDRADGSAFLNIQRNDPNQIPTWESEYGEVPGALVDGDWHHVAIVQDYTIGTSGDAGNVKDTFLYVDGQLVAWTNENLGSTAADAILGGITLGSSSNYRGGDAARLYFDDFAIWSRALDPQEISDLSSQSLSALIGGSAAAIPEPTAACLAALGLLSLRGVRRRRP